MNKVNSRGQSPLTVSLGSGLKDVFIGSVIGFVICGIIGAVVWVVLKLFT